MKKSKNPVGKDFYSLTVTADYFLNRRFKNSLAGEKFAFSGFRLGLKCYNKVVTEVANKI